MYPHERSLVARLADEPFTILGVNSDKTLQELQSVMTKEELTYPSFFDGGGTGGPIATQWGVRGWPTIFIIDHEGVIRYRGRGELDEKIAEYVDKAEKAVSAKGSHN